MKSEIDLIDEMRKKTCCSNNCIGKILVHSILKCCEQCRELQIRCDQHVSHLHLVLLGHMNACLHDTEQTVRSKQKQTDRCRTRLNSTFHGMSVCTDAFHFLHDISRKVTRKLKVQFEKCGLEPKMHGNVAKPNSSLTSSFESRRSVVKFVENYALTNALVLPGRTAGAKNPDALLLPCGTTKRHVYQLYTKACGNDSFMSYSLFCETWQNFLPDITIQKPRTDLCATCRQDTISIQRLRSLDDTVRADLMNRSLKHLELVAGQREHYRTSIEFCRSTLPPDSILGEKIVEQYGISVVQHYSFDFAQQIFISNSSQQVGPLYFLVPYKLALFGIMCEPLGKMVIYVIPESVLVGKGANMVVSLLHHFLAKYSSGEQRVVLNADNCVGQNKNNTVLQYLMWRVTCGLNSHIELALMLAGHTKFGPDYGFGVFKRMYRHAEVNTVKDVCGLIERSKLLLAEPVGTEEGEVLIPCFDWQTKFASAGTISGIKKFHHFTFDSSMPGILSVKEYAKSNTVELQLDINAILSQSQALPATVVPEGLSLSQETGISVPQNSSICS